MHVFLAKIIRICFWRRTKYSLKEKENREFFQKILSENLNSFLIIKFILGLGNVYSIVFFYSTSWKNIHQDNVDDNSIIKNLEKKILKKG